MTDTTTPSVLVPADELLRPWPTALATSFGRGGWVPVALVDCLPRWAPSAVPGGQPPLAPVPHGRHRLAVCPAADTTDLTEAGRLLRCAAGRWTAQPPTLAALPDLAAGLDARLRLLALPATTYLAEHDHQPGHSAWRPLPLEASA